MSKSLIVIFYHKKFSFYVENAIAISNPDFLGLLNGSIRIDAEVRDLFFADVVIDDRRHNVLESVIYIEMQMLFYLR